jgi:hypothetical protein
MACDRVDPLPPPSTLVPDGARPTAIRLGNIDRDAPREAVVASVSSTPGASGIPPPHLEAFDPRSGGWRRVLDGGGPAPPGPPGTPERILRGDGGFVAQSIPVVELVDFEGDGAREIVVAVASAGATSGPVELWIMSADGDFRTKFYEATERGGEVTVDGGRLTFEFPVYRRGDPGCCPSRLETQTIGFDPGAGRIEVLERRRTPL